MRLTNGCRVVIGLGGQKTGRSCRHCLQTSFFHAIPLRPAQVFLKIQGLSCWRFAIVKDYDKVMGLPREATGEEIMKDVSSVEEEESL